jgi:hypothetical protein
MRTVSLISLSGGLVGLVVALQAGCWSDYDSLYLPLTNPELARYGTDGGDGGDGADGSGPDCSGDPSSTNVIDACGIFAQADATAPGDGSMAMPFAKLADAVAAAQTAAKRVYACTSAPFNEAVTISAGIEVYGGLDCTMGWAWSQDARATLAGPADAVALTVTSAASGAKVEGFAITGASPSSMTMGGSSVAVAVGDVAATLDHCDVTASDAAAGVAGQTSTDPVVNGMGAPTPDSMTENACLLPAAVAGGAPGVTTCGGVDTTGGVGGKGGVPATSDGGTSDSDGQQGVGGSPMSTTSGLGGAGESTSQCVNGGTGNDGNSGNAGPGGSAGGDTLSLMGITNSDATDGQPGTAGQGGGGGGGAKSGTFCGSSASPVDGPGASGGGGGAGGCGGPGGGGGKAGGSSIAIVSLGTNLTLTSVTLTVGTGGTGGNGIAGLSGGNSGAGAAGGAKSGIAPSTNGCAGGDGGSGGPGGPGGGGRGGHAIGIAYVMAPVTMPALQMFTSGTPGGGGTRGNGAPASSNGALGNAGQCWNFSTNAACN